jgi:hypothetical protein
VKKTVVCAAMAGMLLLAPGPSWGDPQREVEDAAKRMRQGMQVLGHTVDVLGREVPRLLEVMQRASQEAMKQGGTLTAPPSDGKMPSAETLAQKFRGMQSMLEVMREAFPVMERMQRELDPAAARPKFVDPAPPGPGQVHPPDGQTAPVQGMPHQRVDPDLEM